MDVLLDNVNAAKSGDVAAFEKLIEQSKNMVTSIALSIVNDFDASEDVAQKVYINCWKNLATLKNDQSFLPWLRQSTRYAALNYIRDNKENHKLSGDEAENHFTAQTSELDQPDTSLDIEQQKQLLIGALDDLPVEVREIVLLYYREEQSTKQVSTLLNISEPAVRKRLSRARELIKDDLLNKYGRIMFATAPTLAFTSMTIGSLTYSSSAAASTLSVASKSGFIGKLSWLLSGAFLVSVFAAVIVFFSTSIPLKKMTNEQHKRELKRIRNNTVIWVLASGVLLVLGYEATQGWIGPVAAYTVFAVGLFFFIRQSQKLIMHSLYESKTLTAKEQRAHRRQKLCGEIGAYAGLIIGFAGMIAGLIGAGRI